MINWNDEFRKIEYESKARHPDDTENLARKDYLTLKAIRHLTQIALGEDFETDANIYHIAKVDWYIQKIKDLTN